MMAKLNKYTGLIMLILNIILVSGGMIYTNGKNDAELEQTVNRLSVCETKLEKMDDIIRRLESATARLEGINVGKVGGP
jgi:hypothetical protein